MRLKTPQAAAIYTRISHDPSGERLGVQRQEEDCRAEAQRRGWSVAEIYEDDDRSAFTSKKARPEYQRLLRDIELGVRDGVMIWRLDRLHRQPRELEEFIVVCDKHQVALATVTGDVDLSTSQGRLLARAWGAFAAHESEVRGERLSRAARQRATQGIMPRAGGLYGYDLATDLVKPREAAVIKEVAARLLKGDTLYAVCMDLNRRGVPAPRGGAWTQPSLRRLVLNPRLAGFSTYHGEVVGKGSWRPILQGRQVDRLKLLMTDPSRYLNLSPPRWYLLRRVLVCGRCGVGMMGGAVRAVRHYQCVDRPGARGCGRVIIRAERLEALVVDSLCVRMDSPELMVALEAWRVSDVSWRRAESRYDAAKKQVEVLAVDHARGFLSRVEWLAARPPLLEQLASAKATLDRDRVDAIVADFVGCSARLRSSWSELGGSRRRAIINALVEQIIVLPAPSNRAPVEDRVVVWWRGEARPRIRTSRRRGIAERRVAGAFARCSVEGCNQRYLARGFCSMHYQRWRATGDPGPVSRHHRFPNTLALCEEPGCVLRSRANGRCAPHNSLFRAKDPGRPPCSVKACERKAEVGSVCRKHYNRWRNHHTYDP